MGRAFDHSASGMDTMLMNNILLNSGMQVTQETAGGTFIPLTSSAFHYIVDQWAALYINTGSVFRAQQATVQAGMTPCGIMLQATTAITSVAAGDLALLYQPIETVRIDRLYMGAGAAWPTTISFWAFATVAGTFSVGMRNGATTRSYVTNLSIGAGVWTYYTVTIPGDIAGTWAFNSPALGASINFCFACGSTFQTTAGAWQAGNFVGTSATSNFFGTANNQVVIGGCVAFAGNEGPNSGRFCQALRDASDELPLCMRYYQKFFAISTWGNGSSNAICYLHYVPPMRGAPALSQTGMSPAPSSIFSSTVDGGNLQWAGTIGAGAAASGTVTADARF